MIPVQAGGPRPRHRLRTSAAILIKSPAPDRTPSHFSSNFDPMRFCCPNEDHGPAICRHIDRLRWRSAESADKMRRRLGGFIESVYNTPPGGGSDRNGPGQPLLRKLTASGPPVPTPELECLVYCGRYSLRDQFSCGCANHGSDSGRTIRSVGIGERT
jgi:hypothetical protein